MKFNQISLVLLGFLAVALLPSRGFSDSPNEQYHMVAFVVTTPNPPDNMTKITYAKDEGDEIVNELKRAGYLVIQYPDPDPKYINQNEFETKLQTVEHFSQTSKQVGDVTLFYYLGHGADFGADEMLFIPNDPDHPHDGEYKLLSSIIDALTKGNPSRAVLLIIDACRGDSTENVNGGSENDTVSDTVPDSGLVLEEKATTINSPAGMSLDYIIAKYGLEPNYCDGVFPPFLALKFENPPPGESEISERKNEADQDFSPYLSSASDIKFSPFGAAFLLAIREPNRSLWDINTSIGNNMRCFTSGGGQGFPVAFTPAELPANMLQYYYFGTKRPDLDVSP